MMARNRRARVRFSMIVLPCLLCGPTALAAQIPSSGPPGSPASHRLTVDDVLANASVVDMSLAPDGLSAALVIRRAMTVGTERYGWASGHGYVRTDIWLIGRHSSPRNITQGVRDGSWYWRPVWSPDGRHLAMLSTRAGDNMRLYVWTRRTNSLRRMSKLGVNLEATVGPDRAPMAWISQTRLLCAFMPVGELAVTFAGGPVVERIRDRSWRVAESGAAPSASVLDGGITVGEDLRPQGQLALLDVLTGRNIPVLSANVRSVEISPNRRLAAVVAEDGNLVPEPTEPMRWPDDRSYWPYGHLFMHRRLGIVALQRGGMSRWVAGLSDPYFVPGRPAWSDSGSTVRVMSHDSSSRSEPLSVTVTDTGEIVGESPDTLGRLPDEIQPQREGLPGTAGLHLRGASAITGFQVFTSEPEDGTIVWTIDSAGASPRIRLRLNRHLATVDDDVGMEETIGYRGDDGVAYRGWVLLPRGYRKGQRYPLVVWVYPGYIVRDSSSAHKSMKPHNSDVAFLEPHLWAVNGYAVLQPTIPQSRGEPIVSLPGYVLPAVDTLIARGVVDSGRVMLLGHSHGGIAVYGLLTQTNRFRAAIALSGWSDIVHYYASFGGNPMTSFPNEWFATGMPNFEDGDALAKRSVQGLWIGSTPWASPERWLRNNPIYHFDRVETPLMIVRGDNDGFYMADGDVAFQSLHRLGRRVRYVRYWGEAHTIESPANIRDLWTRMLAWFDSRLR